MTHYICLYCFLVCFGPHSLSSPRLHKASLGSCEMTSSCLGKGYREFPLHMGTKQQHISQNRNKEEHSGANPRLYRSLDINTHWCIVYRVQSIFKHPSSCHVTIFYFIYFFFNIGLRADILLYLWQDMVGFISVIVPRLTRISNFLCWSYETLTFWQNWVLKRAAGWNIFAARPETQGKWSQTLYLFNSLQTGNICTFEPPSLSFCIRLSPTRTAFQTHACLNSNTSNAAMYLDAI